MTAGESPRNFISPKDIVSIVYPSSSTSFAKLRKTMARGRLFSRKYEPAEPPVKPRPLETSPNPLVQLGLAFQKLQNLTPETQPRPAHDSVLPGRQVLEVL